MDLFLITELVKPWVGLLQLDSGGDGRLQLLDLGNCGLLLGPTDCASLILPVEIIQLFPDLILVLEALQHLILQLGLLLSDRFHIIFNVLG